MVGLAFAHIYGPLVFTEASADMLQSIVMRRSGLLWLLKMEDQASPLITRPNDPPNFPGERLVMVSAVLQDKIMRGYNDPTVEVIKTLNGTPVKNLGHLVQLLRDSTNQFDNFELYGHETTTDSMVFSHADMVAAADQILNDNSVRSQGSRDMMAIWNGKGN